MPALGPERRSALLAAKLGALARDHLGFPRPGPQPQGLIAGEPTTFPDGAALRVGHRGAVLIDANPSRALGPTLAWGIRHGVGELHLLVDDGAGQLARQAGHFATPPTVWWVQDRDLRPVQPEPLATPPSVPESALALAGDIEAAGATVVIEHGEVAGEVLGLEVARVVTGPEATALEVGIGRHDREAFAIIHGDRPAASALEGVVASVQATRRVDAPEQPLYRIAQERWLREVLLARPDLVGAPSLARHEGPRPRPNVKDPWPAVAAGEGIVVVASVGVDLDLVPYAAEARAAIDPLARLVLVVPERDALPITITMAASLLDPAEIVTVPNEWRALA